MSRQDDEGGRPSPWTDEETCRFLTSARTSPCGPYWSLRVATGLHAAELLALHWNDVEWERGTVRVSRRMDRGWGWSGIERIPDDQRRSITITVPESMMNMLQAHKRAQREFRLAAGPTWQEHGLVLTTASGTPASVQTLTREFQRLIDHANVPRISASAAARVHGLAPSSERERHSPAEAMMHVLGWDGQPQRPAT